MNRSQEAKTLIHSQSGVDAEENQIFVLVQEYQTMLVSKKAPTREEFLQRYPDLRDKLEPFLAGLEIVHAAASQLQTGPSALKMRDFSPQAPLGDFRIVREIGRGGMGVVYEAMQLSLGRSVALKVLPFASALDPKCLQRFKNEAQAAAQLHHTNIVPVYAVGCDRGVHYYAMQLIDGQPLSAILKQLRKQFEHPISSSKNNASTAALHRDTEPADLPLAVSTGLTEHNLSFFRTITRYGIQAADALDHAHLMGVIHRDIKPGNLLLDGRGNLWVTDFGLAHFQSEAGLTMTGDLVGTLRYMSPEQATGDRVILDHRTDVYSLGVTLYELLTLRPAFTGNEQMTLLRQIREDDPPSPRSIDRTIPIELETIVLKAIAKLPAERYSSAKALAEDLQRYLNDKPILARRPTLIDRSRKWGRRHPSVVGATLVVLLLSVAGLLISNWVVKGAFDREQIRADEAEKRFRQARAAVDLLIRVGEDELAVRPDLQDSYKKLLDVVLVHYQDFIDYRRNDPKAQEELAVEEKRLRQLLADFATLQGMHAGQLLDSDDVRDALLLSKEQDELVEAMSKRWGEQRSEIFRTRDLTPEQRREKFLQLAREQEKSVAKHLSEPQMKRLHQIAIQTKSFFAFNDSEVSAALKLTDDQRKKIREMERKLFNPPFMLGMSPGPGGPGGPRPGSPPERGRPPDHFNDFRVRQSSVMNNVLDILDETQKERWRILIGEPFRGRVAGPPFGPTEIK